MPVLCFAPRSLVVALISLAEIWNASCAFRIKGIGLPMMMARATIAVNGRALLHALLHVGEWLRAGGFAPFASRVGFVQFASRVGFVVALPHRSTHSVVL